MSFIANYKALSEPDKQVRETPKDSPVFIIAKVWKRRYDKYAPHKSIRAIVVHCIKNN